MKARHVSKIANHWWTLVVLLPLLAWVCIAGATVAPDEQPAQAEELRRLGVDLFAQRSSSGCGQVTK
ncbi:MAG: hypothetical protein FJ118_20070 [Deltaproteobacteria bacterium]|nr:hypothetical protein [Deltaproteobacteria bacterium]